MLAAAGCAGGSQDDPQTKIDEPDPNINTTGMPIAKEPVTISFMSGRPSQTADDWNTVAAMKKMEKQSGVHIDWGLVPSEGATEKRNLSLASGDYPEVIYRTGLGAVDLAKYGEQGTLIPLNTLIDKYMPNLKAILAENPDIKRGMTFPDGKIYGLPTIYDPEFASLQMQYKLWVRKDWLAKFGMKTPTTLDEYAAYLKAVKTKDPNGNGKADEIPLTDGGEGGTLYQMLRSSFGVGNRGTSSGYLDAQPDDPTTVRFYPASDGYRDLMGYLHKLYADGLIQKDVFTNDAGKFNNLGSQDLIGSAATQSPAAFFGKVGKNYVALPPLKKTASDPVPEWNAEGSGLRGMGQFVITDKAEHPVAAARWMDYFYGDEGAKLFFLGIEGTTYQKSGTDYEFLPQIADNPDGLTVDEALKPYVIYLGGSYPGIVRESYFKGTEGSAQAVEGTKQVADHGIDEVWPGFTYGSDEATELDTISADVDKFTDESRSAFISGKKPLSDWDDYVAKFDQMGMKRYLEIQQAALDRYRKK
ncbi:extracellular solute-binding protein [Microlunatus soli]|uniref:extracellular solute-binding protein n=1 Tax=Microlunatus soli TaxID=630515 RepID=UPI0012FCA1E8|nr:extracellular solute-binding protein [Microlunatus soli]